MNQVKIVEKLLNRTLSKVRDCNNIVEIERYKGYDILWFNWRDYDFANSEVLLTFAEGLYQYRLYDRWVSFKEIEEYWGLYKDAYNDFWRGRPSLRVERRLRVPCRLKRNDGSVEAAVVPAVLVPFMYLASMKEYEWSYKIIPYFEIDEHPTFYADALGALAPYKDGYMFLSTAMILGIDFNDIVFLEDIVSQNRVYTTNLDRSVMPVEVSNINSYPLYLETIKDPVEGERVVRSNLFIIFR